MRSKGGGSVGVEGVVELKVHRKMHDGTKALAKATLITLPFSRFGTGLPFVSWSSRMGMDLSYIERV